MTAFKFFRFEVNSNLTLDYLPIVISHRYSQQELQVVSFDTTDVIST